MLKNSVSVWGVLNSVYCFSFFGFSSKPGGLELAFLSFWRLQTRHDTCEKYLMLRSPRYKCSLLNFQQPAPFDTCPILLLFLLFCSSDNLIFSLQVYMKYVNFQIQKYWEFVKQEEVADINFERGSKNEIKYWKTLEESALIQIRVQYDLT